MEDAKKLFYADQHEKKVIGRSARHVARAGRRVKMPSDFMTKKEIEKMNGEVQSYNLKNPMKWGTYKAMPDDLKREYLKRLRERYNATPGAVARMMGASTETLRKEFVRLGLERLGKGARVTPEWYSFVNWGTPDRVNPTEPPTVEEETEENPPVVEFRGHDFSRDLREVFAPQLYRTPDACADMVNHPPHYTAGGIECIDAIEAAAAQLAGMEAVCTAQIIKYVWRWKLKNGAEDLKKAGFYLDRLISTVEGNA